MPSGRPSATTSKRAPGETSSAPAPVTTLAWGGANADRIYTGPGNDFADGNASADRIHLGPGDDEADGEKGWDRLYGGTGADTLYGEHGGDYLDGGTGNDQLYGGDSCDSLDGEAAGLLLDDAGNELFGGPGDDYLIGDAGNDRLDAGPGSDYGQGGYHDHRIDWITRSRAPHRAVPLRPARRTLPTAQLARTPTPNPAKATFSKARPAAFQQQGAERTGAGGRRRSRRHETIGSALRSSIGSGRIR